MGDLPDATNYWNDSCSIEEYAIERGAVGATSDPTIVGEVLTKEMQLWQSRIGEITSGHPSCTENEVAWQLIEEMAAAASKLLLPVFEREQGRKGRLSIQTNPKFPAAGSSRWLFCEILDTLNRVASAI